ncbi:MAG: DUF4071 domain-containing protein [Flavobacterium sp. JAD_PAG50586_2]|nr:MAG: DUF4071 domain-containing protein [Flavobacterium sp. JAD_PAG50586_2]
MSKKICFVIMGFGKKTDFSTGNTFDLNQTYKNIIQPAVVKSGYQCVRADEIQDSGLIDRSMYALLIQADLVIADISTYNPNAIYELGVRHAVKPYSTIILKENGMGKIPFDLDHTRMFTYFHLGDDIGTDEARRCVEDLSNLIVAVTDKSLIDSPLYEYIGNVTPPILPKEEYEKIIGDLADKEKHIFAIVDEAERCMDKSDFEVAYKHWEKAQNLIPNEIYFIQQAALAKYKSKLPSSNVALTDALAIILPLYPTNDPETLGITGAIYKNLYQNNNDVEYLNRAIENYGKGFKISENYYTGENYALCLNLKVPIEDNSNEKIYLKVEANKTRKKIIEILEEVITFEEFEQRNDKKWIFATLAHCYHTLEDEKSKQFEAKFLEIAVEWEAETYLNGIKTIDNLKIKL